MTAAPLARVHPLRWKGWPLGSRPMLLSVGADGPDAGRPDDGRRVGQSAPSADVRRDDNAPPGALKVVIIDDDPRIRTLTRMLLDRSTEARVVGDGVDGTEAVDLVERTEPDVVLLDLLMPRLDGHAVLPELVRAAPRTMVLVLSALSGIDEADKSFALGAFAYLEKSVVGPDLPKQIRELHDLFQRALEGETVWRPSGPPRIRR